MYAGGGTPGNRGEPPSTKERSEAPSKKKSGASLFSSAEEDEETEESSEAESVSILAKRVREEMAGAGKSSAKKAKKEEKVRNVVFNCILTNKVRRSYQYFGTTCIGFIVIYFNIMLGRRMINELGLFSAQVVLLNCRLKNGAITERNL